MGKKWVNWIFLILLLSIIIFFGFFASNNNTITGYVLYGEKTNVLNWTFDDVNDYTYDDSLIDIGSGTAKLAPTTTYTYWNASVETDYLVTKALYDPSDKTDKVDSLDNKHHEVKKDKIFEISFADNLDNGDIVSLYLKDGEETDIYLCEIGIICSSPDYGSVAYDGNESWYNITISGLPFPTKTINIITLDKVKFDYITSSQGEITITQYDPKDKTSKIQTKDDDNHDVKKDKLFNLMFDNELENGDIISFYLKDEKIAKIYLCDYGDKCSSTNYGLLDFDGNEGGYNLTLTGLSESKNIFSINPTENIKVDYIKAVHIDLTEHSSTNTSYPESASIETDDVSITGLSSFLSFHKNELLNSQNVIYKYSTDSGTTWTITPSNNNLSEVPISNGKIRIKTDLSGDGTGTPTLYDFAVSYITQVCNENWNVTYGACTSDNTKLKYYLDKNECGTIDDIPTDNGTFDSCVYVTPSTDTLQNTSKLLIDAREDSNVLFKADTKSNISADLITIVEYSTNSKSSVPNLKELKKYIDINTDNKTKSNLSSISIRIYYTDEEVTNAGLDEETLEIHYFNETSNRWQELNSTVNLTGNYVEVIIDHLSTFGIFGEESEIEEGSTSEDENGGDDVEDSEEDIGSNTIIPTIIKPKEEVKTKDQEIEESKEETVDVLAPEEIVDEELDVDADPLEPQSVTIGVDSKIPIFIVIFLLMVIISIFIYFKSFRKNNEELTQEQIGKIEEIVKKSEEKHSEEKQNL